jgi:DNA-binding MarR family transcriptional regulator
MHPLHNGGEQHSSDRWCVIHMRNSRTKQLRLQDYLPYRLSVAANAVSRLIADAYESKFGLSIAQWRLIAVLAEEGPLTQQGLTVRTIMDKVTITRAASELQRRRLVSRMPNESDGRSHLLILSDTGRRLYEEIVPLAMEYEAQLLADIDQRQILQLEKLLRHLESAATARHQQRSNK